MPNHVETRLTVTGDKKQLKKFVESHIVENDDGDSVMDKLDFDTIHECHPDLVKAMSPTRTKEDYANALKRKASKKELKEIEEQIELSKSNLKKYGYANWYDFCNAEWGTKWGAYDSKVVEHTDDIFVFDYHTAWSPAVPIFAKLGKMYPELTFDNVWADEGMEYGGRFIVTGEDVYDEPVEGEEFHDFYNAEFDGEQVKCEKCGTWNYSDEACWRCLEEGEDDDGNDS